MAENIKIYIRVAPTYPQYIFQDPQVDASNPVQYEILYILRCFQPGDQGGRERQIEAQKG